MRPVPQSAIIRQPRESNCGRRKPTMSTRIYTPSESELDSRIGRFPDLQPMSTADELAHIDLKVMDIFFSRKIMPVILEQTKNLFGHTAPIYGAAGTTDRTNVVEGKSVSVRLD